MTKATKAAQARGRLEVRARWIDPPPRARFDLTAETPTPAWSDAETATPLEDFRAVRRMAESMPLTAGPYTVTARCPCGEEGPYPYDAVSNAFGDWECPACGAAHAEAECRAAFRRHVQAPAVAGS